MSEQTTAPTVRGKPPLPLAWVVSASRERGIVGWVKPDTRLSLFIDDVKAVPIVPTDAEWFDAEGGVSFQLPLPAWMQGYVFEVRFDDTGDPVEGQNPYSVRGLEEDGAAMSEMSRGEIEARIGASEARTDTKFARLEGKLDLVLAEAVAVRAEAVEARREARNEGRGTRTAVVVTGLATVLSLGALLMAVVTYGDAIFSRGMSVRDVVKAVVEEQRQQAKPTP